jgi:hypothetical protein
MNGPGLRGRAVCAAVVLLLSVTPRVESAHAVGAVVSGTVSGADEGFLAGASVILDGPIHRETHTDADGRFTFVDVVRGPYRLGLAARAYRAMETSFDVGDTSVALDLVMYPESP